MKAREDRESVAPAVPRHRRRPAKRFWYSTPELTNPKRREKRAWMRANNASGRQWVKHRKAERRAAKAAS